LILFGFFCDVFSRCQRA